MRITTLATLALALGLSIASPAAADDQAAQSFVEKEHDQITSLLRQPPSAARDAQINHTLDTMVDYDELTHRAFGSPCPAAEPGCENHWTELKPEQQAEVTAKLKPLVQK